MTHTSPALNQTGFRARENSGNEATPTWIANLNTNWTQNTGSSFRVRFAVTEANGAAETLSPQLWYSLNGGTWTAVSGSTPIQYATLVGTTDGTATTQQISAGSFVASEVDNNGTIANVSLTSQVTEIEWCLTIDAAQVADTDTIGLRVYDAGSVLSGSYTQAPTITVNEPLNVGVPLDAGSFTLTGFSGVTSHYLEPSPGSFTLTGFDATASTASNVNVPLDAGSFTLSGFAANTNSAVGAGAGSFALTGFDATAATGATVTADAGSFVLTGFSGNTFHYLEPSPGSFALTGYAATIVTAGNTNVALDAGTYALTGNALGIGEGAGTLTSTIDTAPDPDEIAYTTSVSFTGTLYWVVTASATPPNLVGTPAGFDTTGLANGSFAISSGSGTGTIDLSGLAVGDYYLHSVAYRTSDGAFTNIETDAITRPVELAAGSFTLSGFDAAISTAANTNVALDAGTFTLTGYTAALDLSSALGVGGYTLTGYGLSVPISASLDAGSYTLSGFDVAVSTTGNTAVPLDAGAFTLSGFSVAVNTAGNTSVPLDAGSFSYVGYGLGVNLAVPLAAGSFSLTGFDADLGNVVPLGVGSFSLTGHDATVDAITNTSVPLDVGSFVLTGNDMVPVVNVPMGAGSFTLTGYGADLAQSMLMAAGSFTLTGYALGISSSFDSARRVATPQQSANSGHLNKSNRDGHIAAHTRTGNVKRVF